MGKVAILLSIVGVLLYVNIQPSCTTPPVSATRSAKCRFVISELRGDILSPSTSVRDGKEFVEIQVSAILNPQPMILIIVTRTV